MKKNYIFILLLAFCFSNLSLGQEMLLNGGLEDWSDGSPTSWTKAEVLTQSTDAQSGSVSAVRTGGSGTKDLSQTITGIIPGNSYTVNFWYKSTGGDETNARIWCTWKNGSTTVYHAGTGSAAGDDELRNNSGYLDNNGGVWTQHTVTVTAPADVDSFYYEVRSYTNSTTYWDSLSFVNNTTVTDPCTTDATQSAAGVAAFDLTMGSALTAIGDGTTFEIIDNPDFDNAVNTSCKVGKVTKLGAQNWDNTQIDFDSKFDFSTTNAITIKVWSAQADTEVRIKLEEIGNPDNNLEKVQTTSVTSGWEELTFEYTSANSDKYNKFVIFFNLNAGDSNTYYFDDLKLVETGGTSDGDYCEKVVAHLGLSDQAASEIKLTVVNSGEKSMKVTIESNNEDAVDSMLIPGDVTGSPTQSAVDSSVAGKMSITLTWAETAPTDVTLNLLWSKVSTEGNWQLGEAPTTFKFDATCATAGIDDKLLVSFSMYPNPASSSLNISASSMIKNAVIYNILGKQVMNLSINKNSESINVSNLASGMYLIKYTTESAVGTAKFIKK